MLATQKSTPENTTYPSPNLKDYTLDDNVLERNLPLDNGRHNREAAVDFGILDTLPLEILHELFMLVDLRSLTDLRRVNQRAMQVVDSIPQYQSILKHGRALLRSVLATDTGTYTSCHDLFASLTTATCENCHDFGGFIYLLTCRRVCFLCFSEDVKYLPLRKNEVKRRFGLGQGAAAKLPCIKTIPGRYSSKERVCRGRLTLYDYESARRAAEEFHGSAAAMDQHVAEVLSNRLEAYQHRLLLHTQSEDVPVPRRPSHAMPRDGQVSSPIRFMGVVRAPWLNVSMKTEYWGFHCVGFRRQYRARPLHWRRKYSMETFNDHIRECGQIDTGNQCHLKTKQAQ